MARFNFTQQPQKTKSDVKWPAVTKPLSLFRKSCSVLQCMPEGKVGTGLPAAANSIYDGKWG